MPFCATCGAEVQGRFCAKCGSAVGHSVGATVPPVAQAQPMATSGGLTENAASALCYVLGLITGIIFLVLAPYNQNRSVRFHAFQSIFLNVGIIIVEIGLSIVFAILRLTLPLLFIWPLIGLGVFVLWLALIIMTYQGKKIVLPIIGDLAQKQA